MRAHDIFPPPNSRFKAKRKGRGISAGQGKTAGRGHKGQKARSGGKVRRGFEGGQTPLTQRLPKRGFTNIFKKEWALVNVKDLNDFEEGSIVNPESLKEKGLVKNLKTKIKILGNGILEKKLTVQAHGFSKAAEEKIVSSGGKVEVL
ncbi:MAG: 50S ribosomal protein L15 [Firmicutes bacterium]|nr:50S ribosomal protein L15 [Bacillota bacterium]